MPMGRCLTIGRWGRKNEPVKAGKEEGFSETAILLRKYWIEKKPP